jgi:hypothetical protein
MALPSSGQISMDDIRAELGVPSQSPFSMNTARQGGYVAINQFSPSIPPFSGQVSLSDWYNYCQNCGYNSGTFYYSSVDAATACAGTPNQTLYWSGTLGIGTALYTDSTGNTYASAGYWSDGTNAYYQVTPNGSYGITSITACATSIAYDVRYESNLALICSETPFTVYIINTGTFNTGATVYTDAALTIPLSGNIYISEVISGTIWNIDSSTGLIGSSTGTIC